MTAYHPFDWFQAKGVGPDGKFHAAVWRQTGPGTNYKPFAICSWSNRTEYRLDKDRPMDDEDRITLDMCRLCRHKIKQQEEENTVTTSYDDDGYPIGHPATRGKAHDNGGALGPTGNSPDGVPGSRRYAAEKRAERHRIALERAEADLARLESLPEEPEFLDGEPAVVWFRKVFQNGSIPYDYAACKGSNGLWYTTGPASPKGYAWQALVEWIFEGESADLWVATQFEATE